VVVTKVEAWRQWWKEKHGQNMPMGGYHPMEGHIYDAFTAGWDAAKVKCCNHNCNEGRDCPERK
jgi:hypothetical protein